MPELTRAERVMRIIYASHVQMVFDGQMLPPQCLSRPIGHSADSKSETQMV